MYTDPITFIPSDPLTGAQLNVLQDNIRALKDPPTGNYELDEVSDYSTTSTSFVDVDGTNLSLTITTTGGDILVGFHGLVESSNNAATIGFDVDVDGVAEAGDWGMVVGRMVAGLKPQLAFTRLITGLAAGSHTFKLQWRTNTGTATLFSGAGTSLADVHPQFWVKEV